MKRFRVLPFVTAVWVATGMIVPVPAEAGEPLVHEGIVDAPVEDVWKAFTTREGLESWMVPHAEIDLRIGGKMRTNYHAEGELGDENTIENTILSFEPNRMLSIRCTRAPSNFPYKNAIQHMWSVVYFDRIDAQRTRVRVVGLGYGDDEESQAMREHFDWGNAWTLQKLKEKFKGAVEVPATEPKRPD